MFKETTNSIFNTEWRKHPEQSTENYEVSEYEKKIKRNGG